MTATPPRADPDLQKVATVADLTDEHIGWEIRVSEPGQWIDRRYFLLGAIRRWEYEGEARIGLLDKDTASRPFIGTERVYAPDTACSLVRQIKKSRQRRGASRG
jgi:hypothetical protein